MTLRQSKFKIIGFYKETRFKETPIGEIPENWELVKLSSISRITMGQSPPSSSYNREGIGLPFIQGKKEFGRLYPTPVMYTSKPIKIAEKGDLLMAVRAPVGDVNIAQTRLCIGRGLASLRFIEDKADTLFYFYYFQLAKPRLEALGRGSTFKAITKDDLEEFLVPLPPLEEQKAIAHILSTVDEAIQKSNEIISRIERFKKALMNMLLTGRVRVKEENGKLVFYRETEFKDTEIGRIPGEWEVVKLGDVCKFKRGFSYRSDQITKDPTEIRLITINDFEKEGGLKRDAERVYIKEGVHIDPDFFITDGDVLIANTDMSKGFIIGAPILFKGIDGKFVYSMDLTKLIFDKSKIDSEFLFYYLTRKTVRQIMKTFAQGTNVLHLNHRLVKNMNIPLPPLPEQKAIAHILSTVDEAIQKSNEIILRIERLKRSLMELLLTGKVRVVVDDSST